MEFNFSALLAAVSVYVFNSMELRNVFNNGNKSFEVVSFEQINNFLLEKFSQSGITFLPQFGVFPEIFVKLDS